MAAIIAVEVAVLVPVTVVVIVIAAAIAAVLTLAVDVALDRAEILVKLLYVIVEVFKILVDLADSVGNVTEQVDHGGKQLALRGGLVNVEAFSQSFEICGFFAELHFSSPSFPEYYAGSGAGEIFARAGIDLDNVAAVDKERDLDLGAGLKRCGLERVGGGVSRKAGIGIGHLKLHECGRLYVEDLSLVGNELAHHLFLHELEGIGQGRLVERNGVECFHIHEVIQVAVVVGILHIFSFDICAVKLVGRAEGLLDHTARDDIFQLRADKCSSLAGFYVLKFNYLIDAAVHLKGDAVFEITSDYHKKYLRHA